MELTSSSSSVRIQEFRAALSEENISLKTLRELCFNGKTSYSTPAYLHYSGVPVVTTVTCVPSGIPFEGGIRALCWKVCEPASGSVDHLSKTNHSLTVWSSLTVSVKKTASLKVFKIAFAHLMIVNLCGLLNFDLWLSR